MVNGEVSLIIDLDDPSRLSKCVTVTHNNDIVPTATYAADRYEVDLSDGHEYAGQIDITNGDCSTPIFYKKSGATGFTFKTGYILPETYSFTIWVDYADDLGYGMHNWYKEDVVWTFRLFKQTYTSFTLVKGEYFPSICKFVFHKEGSNGDAKFNYWMTA